MLLLASVRWGEYPTSNNQGHHGVLVVTVINESDIVAHDYLIVVHAPIRVAGKLVIYEDSRSEESGQEAYYRISFSNAMGPPLFPHSERRVLFPFKFLKSLTPLPKRERAKIDVQVFADAMPKLSAVFTPSDILELPELPSA